MRQFYSCFPIRSALRSELTWTHYKALIRVDNDAARAWYMEESASQAWTVRALERQIASLYSGPAIFPAPTHPVSHRGM